MVGQAAGVAQETLAIDLLRDLAERLAVTRPLAVLDIEATGPYPDRDRIVELAVLKVLPGGEVRDFQSFVNPEEPIPAEATAVHGITDAMVAAAPTFRELGPRVAAGLTGCDVVAYNLRRFDQRILAAECARIGRADPLEGAKVVDPFVIFQRQAPRDLAAAMQHYVGRAFEGHRAMDDVLATVRVLHAQLSRAAEVPQTLDALHDYCLHRDPSFVDESGKLVWRGGQAVIAFGKHAGTPLADLAAYDRGFLQWILRSDFPRDTKQIVMDALDGAFPTPPAANGGAPSLESEA